MSEPCQLNETQKVQYMEDPNHCPWCGSEDIEAGPMDDNYRKRVECTDCGRAWREYYTVTFFKVEATT